MVLLSRLVLVSALLSFAKARRILPQQRNLLESLDDGKRRAVSVTTAKDPDEHLVTDLPLSDERLQTQQWAGLLPANNKGDKYLFYWLFEPDLTDYKGKDDADIPLLIWLNGGPGCSSMDGLFIENGPLQLSHDGGSWKVTTRDYSWHKAPAYTLYIDQPVGTGLSFTTSNTYPKNDDEVNTDFFYFIQQFLKLHSDKFVDDSSSNKVNRPVFFSGESHAGHYIPSMMAFIQRQKKADIQIDLTGAAIGNGWVDPNLQYAAAKAAYGHGLIGLAQQHALDAKERDCQAQLAKGNYRAPICFSLLDDVVAQSQGGSSNSKVSQYDVRVTESKHASRSFPPGHKDIEAYLGHGTATPKMNNVDTTKVLKAIHATESASAGQVYQECTDPPYNALAHQDGLGVVDDVVQLLESGVQLLFFNGIMDLICNHVGNELMLEQLPWSHQQDWVKASRSMWKAESDDSAASGYYKAYKNLSFLKVMNAGHMVPLDVPNVALDMLKTFMHNPNSFSTSAQKLDRKTKQVPASCPVCPSCPAAGDGSSSTDASQVAPPASSSDSVMTFVIAHSWIGALMAVVVFLLVLMVVRKRQWRQDSRLAAAAAYSTDLEMKQYRDNVENGDDHYHDEPQQMTSNGKDSSRIV